MPEIMNRVEYRGFARRIVILLPFAMEGTATLLLFAENGTTTKKQGMRICSVEQLRMDSNDS